MAGNGDMMPQEYQRVGAMACDGDMRTQEYKDLFRRAREVLVQRRRLGVVAPT